MTANPNPKATRLPFKEVEATRPDYADRQAARFIKVPEPNFRAGQGMNGIAEGKHYDPRTAKYRSIKPEDHDTGELYRMMISAVTPRPIGFISTLSTSGIPNLAPMSYFNLASANPPTIMLSIQSTLGSTPQSTNTDGLKDTNANILHTKEFCVSVVSEWFLEAMNYTSLDAPGEVDEFELAGLTKRESETVKPPHVGESAFSMECRLLHWYDIKNAKDEVTNTVILGTVQRFHVNEHCFSGDELKMDPIKLMPVSRFGGITFGRTTELMELPRPYWKDVKDSEEVRSAMSRSGQQSGL